MSRVAPCLTAVAAMVFASMAQADCTYTVNFAFNSSALSVEDATLVDRIAQAYPSGPLSIRGHTDLVGGDAANFALSGRRVATVVNRLRAAGATGAAVASTESLGQTEPVVATEAREVLNRRVQIITPECLAVAPVAGLAPGTLGGIGPVLAAGAAILVVGLVIGGGGAGTTTTTTTTAPGR